MGSDNLKILSGSSINLPELDEEETETFIEDSIIDYDFSEFLEAIGKDNFKEIFYMNIQEIINLESKKQTSFCYEILDKIEEVYNFEFPIKVSLSDQEDFNEVYNLIRFIEFEYIGFFSNIWNKLLNDISELKNLNINNFINKKQEELIKIIDKFSNLIDNELISEFIRTYTKSNFIEFFVKLSNKSRMLIILKKLEDTIK